MDNFLKKVEINKDCWIWKGAISNRGHGIFYDIRIHSNVPAHSYAYQIMIGSIEKGNYLVNTCGNSNCANPHHFTQKAKGSNNGSAALMNPIKTKERILSNMKISEYGCWEWQKSLNEHGYGQTTLFGKQILAHRASYILHKGKVPDGLIICHTCDNRKCINPDHLYAGTYLDNARDAIVRRRIDCAENGRKTVALGFGFKKGHINERHRTLSNESVIRIKKLILKGGISSQKIANQENTTIGVVIGIRKGRTYNNVKL